MTIENQIVEYLILQPEASVKDLQEKTGASRQIIHRILKNMLVEKTAEKIGRAPRVYYRLLRKPYTEKSAGWSMTEEEMEFLNEHFLIITETGKRLEGSPALEHWCARQKLPFEKTAREFVSMKKKYSSYISTNGLINGIDKLKNTRAFEILSVDGMFYCDFYAIERFGKTKLGTLLHFAKQGQIRSLMEEVIDLSKTKAKDLIKEKKIEAVGFIPPTIKRHLQFMKVLQSGFNFPLPHLDIIKVSGVIPVPQKALNKIEDRIENARTSIIVKDTRQFGNVLLIDDAVGSGATINETATKLKQKKTAIKVYGLAITGSFKGFDVIQEV